MAKPITALHEGIQKRNAYQVPPEAIEIEKGWNPRKDFNKDGLQRLAKSIVNSGLKTPLLVRRDGDRIVLVDGERRLRAILYAKKALKAPIKTVPVEFESRYSNESDALFTTVLANELREDLSPIERAEGYKRLLDFGMEAKDVAEKLGRDGEHVTRSLRLLQAAPKVRKALIDGLVAPSVVSELVRRFPDDKRKQESALADALASSGGKKAKGKDVRKAASKKSGGDPKPRRRTRKWNVLHEILEGIEEGDKSISPPKGSYIDGFVDALKVALAIDDIPDWTEGE